MRLIDADELKKCVIPCEIHNGALTDLCVPLYQIDNAPTVKVPENTVSCVLTMFGKCSYNETGCSDCEIKDKIRKALSERPQGEWITKNAKEPCGTDESHETIYRLVPRPHCNKCNISQIRKTYFCPNCGADMRGNEE